MRCNNRDFTPLPAVSNAAGMKIIRECHHKTQAELKQLLIGVIDQNGLAGIIRWQGFTFEGKTKGTTIKGEIGEQELRVEIAGWFETVATHQLRQGWQELVRGGLV